MVVLATIGHVLLIILFVVLILFAGILFLPVFYKIKAVKAEEEQVCVNGSVNIIFGLIRITFEYDKDGFDWHVFNAGFPISDTVRDRRARRRRKLIEDAAVRYDERESAKKQPTIKPGGNPFENRTNTDNGAHGGEEEEKPGLYEKIGLTIKGIYDKIVLLRKDVRALFLALPHLLRLLKHIRPRKIAGELVFGFDEPSTTGQVLGLIGTLYPLIPEKLVIIPDFQDKIFSCDLTARGHLFIIYLVIGIIRIFRIYEVRRLIFRINSRRRKK